MDDKLSALPNAFYDVIVFASSTLLFAAGLLVGTGRISSLTLRGLGTLDVIVICALLFVASYEYGRLAETWSAYVVQRPLRFLHKHGIFFRDADFLAPLGEVEQALGFSPSVAGRPVGKWGVYFHAVVVCPRIGHDLLKRYAWEKLARSSAFTFIILALMSLAVVVASIAGMRSPFEGPFVFGSPEGTLTWMTLAIIASVEYFQRNCWNSDLLLKVLPVLRRAESLGEHHTESVVRVLGLEERVAIRPAG